ncbi:elongation factor 1-gamma [Tremella mesenterica]|uniref:Elongation factor 1-gamma n=1 Tax=Tremella mesenterica TaxID=5217 RepID=A0A4Q1BDH5_TREME|nr:uncharacterized protein TREMEDRAFT_56155 [Tremella mesenterica DSM 1558]EIW73240.1 hypothetical protein TREMEDRAFT_56155 [Tremella mesenterica DSM 1558]RXK34865.1 elongation factor 1-gamma [Tremella mesenterica]
MAPTLTGFPGNSRVRRVLAAAAMADVELEHDKSFTFKSDWRTEAFLRDHPMGYLPVLEDGELKLSESAAIAEYVASLGANQTILPADPKQRALVKQWMCTADQEIMIPTALTGYIFNNTVPYSKATFNGLMERLWKRLNSIEAYMLHRTFLVGERLTLADITIVTSLTNLFTSSIFDASSRAKVPNLVRLVETVIRHPKLALIFDNGNPQWTEVCPPYQAPAKEKPAAAEKAPKAEAAPKAPKAPKKKEEEEEEEEDLVPAEPKAKNPLDDLPKSAFNLEEWKRQYSNLDTRKEALPWFYEKFDKEGFSIWRVDFKYNDELTQTFMSNNLIGGFFNRLEASRKYLFGSMGVLGKTNDSIVTGTVICRGPDYKPVMDVAPDWESYEYKKIDLENPEDKAFFEAALAWDLEIDGKAWVDGKNFK